MKMKKEKSLSKNEMSKLCGGNGPVTGGGTGPGTGTGNELGDGGSGVDEGKWVWSIALKCWVWEKTIRSN